MYEVAPLAALLCAIQPQISPEKDWTHIDCIERAQEFVEAGEMSRVDPLLLVAVSVFECNLRERAELRDRKGRRVVAIDACPMGLRFTGSGFWPRRGRASR